MMETRGVVEGPILKLTMEKGPLAGQGLEFKPGFTVRVGRVVRGNNLTIKDSGISSKHLSIEFNSSDGKWVIHDLGSSNGTFLNAVELDPSYPAALSDCDVIKIGELTSIKVQIEGHNGASTKPRRNPRRKAATDTTQTDDGDAAENCELGLVDEEVGNNNKGKMRRPPCARTRARTRAQKDSDSKSNKAELQPEGIGLENAGLRMTRSSSKAENFNDGTSQIEIAVVEKAESLSAVEIAAQYADENGGQRKTRCARGRGCRELRDHAPIEQPLGKTKRATRSRKQRDLQAESVTAVHLEDEERAAKMSIPKEHTQCKVEAIQSIGEDRQVEGHNTVEELLNFREGCHGVSNTSGAEKDEHEVQDQTKCQDETIQTMEEDGQVEGNHTVEEQLNLGEEACHGLSNVSGGNNGKADVGEVNLEILTLGEWLDYLEILVPKQIIDATEEMISEMRKKAEKLQEFILHQKNGKENHIAAME